MKRIAQYFGVILLVLFLAAIVNSEDITVYVTRTGSKYHVAGCGYLRKSMIPMKLSEAAQHYSPCSRCNPPKNSSIEGSSKSQKDTTTYQKSSEDSIVSSDKAVGTTATGKTIYQGPRGGLYHYSKSGKKVYEKRR